MCHCFQVTLNGWHVPIRPGRDLACSPVTGDAPLLGCLAAESFLLYLGGNEALATQVQICYLKSHTSSSVTQAVMLNTPQLVFERVRRGVTNPWPWSHRQHINCSNPCSFHGCFTQTALLRAGGEHWRPRGWEVRSQQELLQPSSPSCPGPSSTSPLCSMPLRAETLGCYSRVLQLPPVPPPLSVLCVLWLAAFLVFGCSGQKGSA